MKKLRIAMAQVNPTLGDLPGNAEKINEAIGLAREADADIVSFPELALCGYPPEDMLLRPSFLQDCGNSLRHITEHVRNIVAVIGFPHFEEKRVYNAAAAIKDARLLGIYHKIELPNYGVFDEKRYFKNGDGWFVIEIDGIRLMLTICEDIWIDGGHIEKSVNDNAADVVLNISASPFHAGKFSIRKEIVAGFAKRTSAFVCYNNLVGGQDELVFDGGSMVINPEGELLAMAGYFEEDLLLTDLEIESAGEETEYARVESETRNTHIQVKRSPYHGNRRKVAATVKPELTRLEEIYNALVLGTRDYVVKNGFKEVVIGLSGGIDSSLTAAVAAQALGSKKVIGITMPSEYTSAETLSDAELLAINLEIRLIKLPIDKIFSVYLDVLDEKLEGDKAGITHENLQARIRGNLLMAFSNRFGWLVLTTGNKSETAVGYATLYGDMAGGFAVIKDVPKTLVYELSEHINKKAGYDMIPRSVIDRPPTAELRPHQKDEDSLPPYPVLDTILQSYVEEDRDISEIIALNFERNIVREVIRMVDRNEYKRRQAPPGIKITPKSFGKDRRLPITNRYRQQ